MLHENDNSDSPRPTHWTCGSYRARLQTAALDLPCRPGGLLDALADQIDPVMLDSSALHETYGRHSIVACRPNDVLSLRNGVLTDARGNILAGPDDEAIWAALKGALGAIRARPLRGAPYGPGWIGYIGYEVARHIEKLPGLARRDTSLPDMRLAFYDSILLYDALKNKWSLVSLEFDASRPFGDSCRDALLSVAGASTGRSAVPAEPTERADAAGKPLAGNAESNFTPKAYRRTVTACTDYIAAGDIFQVNLSQRFTVPDAPEPVRSTGRFAPAIRRGTQRT